MRLLTPVVINLWQISRSRGAVLYRSTVYYSTAVQSDITAAQKIYNKYDHRQIVCCDTSKLSVIM